MNQPFDLDSFIAGINQDKSQPRNSKDRLNRVLMNVRDNQGTLTFVPIYSKSAKNFYIKLSRVYEYYGDTSLLDSGEAWYRILPLECYGQLSPEQIELYHEVKGYLDTLNDNEEVGYDEFRVRNYSLFYGLCQSLKNSEGKYNEDLVNAPCLFVYPSANVVNQLCDSINAKIDVMKGRKDWLAWVLSLSNTGRKGVVQVKFVKADGAGYDCTVAFEFNSELNTVIDPEMEISEDIMSKFDDVMPAFLGWLYDNANKQYFNEVGFKELRDQLKLRVKAMTEGEPEPPVEAYPNMNNLTPGQQEPTMTPTGSASRKPF
jgi:hypothetical protein